MRVSVINATLEVTHLTPVGQPSCILLHAQLTRAEITAPLWFTSHLSVYWFNYYILMKSFQNQYDTECVFRT